jgi:branched-chain amino acid transport system ATP-binding protein
VSVILQAKNLTKQFGGVVAVDSLELELDGDSLVGLIGPNGSGKTTTLNLLNGALAPSSGSISVHNRNLAGKSSSSFVRAGVTRTFQHPRVFSTLTAVENLLVPVLHQRGSKRSWSTKAESLLAFVGLAEHRDTPASELSGGQQKLLEFVRALMTDPGIILMDEPFAGIHPSVKELLRERIAQKNAEGTAFLIVSHEIPDLTRMCSQIICMAEGRIIAHGTPETVITDPAVVEAYLGRGPASRGKRG